MGVAIRPGSARQPAAPHPRGRGRPPALVGRPRPYYGGADLLYPYLICVLLLAAPTLLLELALGQIYQGGLHRPRPHSAGPIGPRGGGPEAAMLESCFCVLHRLCEYFLGAGLEDGSPPPHAVFVSNAQGRDSPGPCLTPFSSTCLPINGLAFL